MTEENHRLSCNEPEQDGSLLLRFVRGTATEAENARIRSWLKEQPGNEKILLHIAQIHDARRTAERILGRNVLAAYHNVLRRRNAKGRRAARRRLAAVAACAALVVSLTANCRFMIKGNAARQFVTVQTNAGMRTRLNLPDGTEVHLNSAGKLTYPTVFDARERRVTLDGEAYFKVARDARRPFVVKAEGKPVETVASGTEFNMQAYASDSLLRTTLVEGAVKLGMQNETGRWKYVRLNPSENALYNAPAHTVRVSRRNTVYDTAWMQGRLIFRDMSVPEVLTRLSHFYNVTFETEDPVIHTYAFTGTFENRQLSQILDYLAIASQIRYTITPPAEDDSQGVKRTKVTLTKR
jgi:ferric-dicitrate binding protein FerR (iron transport regulator)